MLAWSRTDTGRNGYRPPFGIGYTGNRRSDDAMLLIRIS
jgi:hypothetical protein